MRSFRFFLMVLLGIATVDVAGAQTVQLPTFYFAAVGTTVSVPDRGSALLGGIGRSGSFSGSRGLPLAGKVPGVGRLARNRSLVHATGAGNIHVTATIIDHAELDKAVLAQATSRAAVDHRAVFLSRKVGRRQDTATGAGSSAGVADLSVSEIRRRSLADAQQLEREARQLYERGRRAEDTAKYRVATIYYQMATRRSAGQVKEQALARVEVLEDKVRAGHVAVRSR